VDWSIIEKLAPSLAWPIVALIMFLIAVPVFYHRLGKLIEAILALRDLPRTLQESMKEHERLTLAFKDQFTTANKDIDETARKVQALVGDLATIRNELQTYQTEAQTDALAAESKSIEVALGPTDSTALEFDKSTADMFETAMGKWVIFMNTFERRLKDAGIDYDMRKIGRGAFDLTDRRRRAPLSRDEAELITNLARQARRFTRLADTKDEWLNPDVYLRFVNGVDVASKAIARHKSNGAGSAVG
jgi:chromosome segregation ATPase